MAMAGTPFTYGTMAAAASGTGQPPRPEAAAAASAISGCRGVAANCVMPMAAAVLEDADMDVGESGAA